MMSESPVASPTMDESPSEFTTTAVEVLQERSESDSLVPETLSAKELHILLLRCHRLGARARLRLIGALLALSRSELYVMLGCSSIDQYAAKYFGYGRTLTYDSLRVAEVIDTLPKLRQAFANGDLSWSALRELTRIAGPDSEETWLKFAAHPRTLKEIQAEVADALRNGRKLPRDNRYGLPNLKVKFCVDLEPQQYELVARALDLVSEGMASRLGTKGIKTADALVHLAQAVLERGVPGESASNDGDGPECETSIFTILYRTCPDCRASHVSTESGFVEVDPSVVDRIEGDAVKEEIPLEEELSQAPPETTPPSEAEAEPAPEPIVKDRPNPRGLVRKVRLRDGGCCANPHCGRTHGLHAHHIQFRVDGGRTALFNEILLCSGCHSLIHHGLLEIRGDVLTGLTFVTAADRMNLDLGDEEAELASLPQVRLVEVNGKGESTRVDSGGAGGASVQSRVDEFPHILKLLQRLGWSEKEARERIAQAIETGPWGDGPIHEQKLFELAVRR